MGMIMVDILLLYLKDFLFYILVMNLVILYILKNIKCCKNNLIKLFYL